MIHRRARDLERFLPTPSRGGRQLIPFCNGGMLYFYPRPHVEGDLQKVCDKGLLRNFYPRPHVEGDSVPIVLEAASS